MFYDLRSEVIDRFVDLDEIVDHHNVNIKKKTIRHKDSDTSKTSLIILNVTKFIP